MKRQLVGGSAQGTGLFVTCKSDDNPKPQFHGLHEGKNTLLRSEEALVQANLCAVLQKKLSLLTIKSERNEVDRQAEKQKSALLLSQAEVQLQRAQDEIQALQNDNHRLNEDLKRRDNEMQRNENTQTSELQVLKQRCTELENQLASSRSAAATEAARFEASREHVDHIISVHSETLLCELSFHLH